MRFLALSVSDAAEDVIAVIRAARGYVTKTISGPELVDAVSRVAEGDAVFSPRLAGFVLDAFGGELRGPTDPELDQLTSREREVLRHLARGYSYKEIARQLSISVKTVETHASAVLRKLQLSNRHQLSRWASDRRLVWRGLRIGLATAAAVVLIVALWTPGREVGPTEIAAAQHASEPIPVYDRTRNRFYAVWHDNRNDELDVFFSSSADARTWSAPRRVNDDPLRTRVGQHYPQISVSQGGRVDVAWYDWRDDPFPPPSVGLGNTLGLFTNRGKIASVYLSHSRDGGRTWSRNVKVNDVPIDRTIGTWANNYDVMVPPAIASMDTEGVVAWSDTRHGTTLSQTQDLVTSTVTFEKTNPRRVTELQSAIVGGLIGAGLTLWIAVWLLRRPSQRSASEATERVPVAQRR